MSHMFTVRAWYEDLRAADFVLLTLLLLAVLAAVAYAASRGYRRGQLALAAVVSVYVAAFIVMEYSPLPSLAPPLPVHHGVNILLTVPFGVGLPLVSRWRLPALLCAVVALPLFVETSQLLISVMVGYDWKAFDAHDLVTKTIGGALGLAAASLARRSYRGARSAEAPVDAPA